MKRFAAIFLSAVCTLSLTACGSQKPSLDEVEKAISEGNVTVEDALEKGWVTQESVSYTHLELRHCQAILPASRPDGE